MKRPPPYHKNKSGKALSVHVLSSSSVVQSRVTDHVTISASLLIDLDPPNDDLDLDLANSVSWTRSKVTHSKALQADLDLVTLTFNPRRRSCTERRCLPWTWSECSNTYSRNPSSVDQFSEKNSGNKLIKYWISTSNVHISSVPFTSKYCFSIDQSHGGLLRWPIGIEICDTYIEIILKQRKPKTKNLKKIDKRSSPIFSLPQTLSGPPDVSSPVRSSSSPGSLGTGEQYFTYFTSGYAITQFLDNS